MEKPIGYENDLSSYREIIYDSASAEPIGWGFKILNHLGDRFDELRKYGKLECLYPDWFLVVKTLSREEAIKKYGEITNEEFGVRGGWKSVTFGKTKFISRYLR